MSEIKEESTVVCRLRIPLHPGQSYLQSVPAAYPDMLLEINSYLPISKEEVTVNLRLSGNVPMPEIIGKIRESPDVKIVEVLHQGVNGATLRVRSLFSNPSVISVGQEFQLLPEFPVRIKAGAVSTIVVASSETIRRLYAQLKEKFPGTIIESIKREVLADPNGPLTPHQFEVFRMAMSSGFWDMPRRVTLSDLASMLGVAKSTIHETIASIENKLMHEESSKLFTQW